MLTIDVTNKINETFFEDMLYEIQDIVKTIILFGD
jgi:hypothetical protein